MRDARAKIDNREKIAENREIANGTRLLAHRIKYRCAGTKIMKKCRCGSTTIAECTGAFSRPAGRCMQPTCGNTDGLGTAFDCTAFSTGTGAADSAVLNYNFMQCAF